MTKLKSLRCAIYTRKSSEEGLEQDFNSLHAQREACEAYIRSQVGEGWVALEAAYDDGGYSGGSMDRPGLRRLLKDIEAKRIDVVVVYKVDRLTRSLTDFARIVETFDTAGASFVSVTQAFNTTTSMGRLTLNVLLSFAQFEREVTGERIRDKIAASKAKGLWMGGNIALGYDASGRTLVINPTEANLVRHIFERYLELGSVHQLKVELEEQGHRSKRCQAKNGNVRGGVPINRGALFHLLSNRLYLGEVPHKGAWHPGQHPAIVDAPTFDAVQKRLLENAGGKRRAAAGLEPLSPNAPLTGLIFAEGGDRLSPVSARGRSGAVYRYYVATPSLLGKTRSRAGLRVAAPAIEGHILKVLRRYWSIPDGPSDVVWRRAREVFDRVELGERRVRIAVRQEAWQVRRSEIDPSVDQAGTDVNVSHDGDTVMLVVDVEARRRGGRVSMVGPDGRSAIDEAKPAGALTKALARAERWKRQMASGAVKSVQEIATSEGIRSDYILRVLRLAFLAPDLKRAVLDGRPPSGLTLQAVIMGDVPDLWSQQRKMFGAGR